MKSLVALACGLVFGLGLGISGMTDPQKVQNFLDFAGTWDPSLAFVMGGAVTVSALGSWLARRRDRAVLGARFPELPSAVDGRLLAGSALFGVGWGLVGLCPGPALANLARPEASTLVFVASMLAGMALHQLTRAREASSAAAEATAS